MASFNKFQDFVAQLATGVHQLHAAGHTVKVYLSNEAPLATDTVKASIAEITAQNGIEVRAEAREKEIGGEAAPAGGQTHRGEG